MRRFLQQLTINGCSGRTCAARLKSTTKGTFRKIPAHSMTGIAKAAVLYDLSSRTPQDGKPSARISFSNEIFGHLIADIRQGIANGSLARYVMPCARMRGCPWQRVNGQSSRLPVVM